MAPKRKSTSTKKKKKQPDAPELYQVRKILAKRIGPSGGVEYKIRWKGFNSNADTWEPIDNCVRIFIKDCFILLFQRCPDLIAEFERKDLAKNTVKIKRTAKNVKTIPAMTRAAEKRRRARLNGTRKVAVAGTGEVINPRRSQRRSSAASRTSATNSLSIPAPSTDPSHNCSCNCQSWKNELMTFMRNWELRLIALENGITMEDGVQDIRAPIGSISFPEEEDVDESIFTL